MLNLNASAHSEYQQKQKSPQPSQRVQSPKSLHNVKVPITIQMKSIQSQVNGSQQSSSIFKNEHLAGSPQLSNRMREIQSQTSSSVYSNSLKAAVRKLPKQSKLLPTVDINPAENSKQKTNSNASKDPKKTTEEKKAKAEQLPAK